MSSIIDTTAVALRRGTTAQNDEFVGVQGEVVVDLGEEVDGVSGVDNNVTLRVHNGITPGGIKMCRQDMQNVTTTLLAENRELIGDRNLAYSNLSNLDIISESNQSARKRVVDTMHEYGLGLSADINKCALINMKNITTESLAEGRNGESEGKNLAYADTSNVNTADLTNKAKHSGLNGNSPLAYANCQNVDTTHLVESTADRPASMSGPVLAKNDLSNVPQSVWSSKLEGVELTSRKVDRIDTRSIIEDSYPTVKAVKDYYDEMTLDGPYLTRKFENVDSWEALYTTEKYHYHYTSKQILNAGTGFEKNIDYQTNVFLPDEKPEPLTIAVTKIDANGKILEAEFTQGYVDANTASSGSLHIKSETNKEATIEYSIYKVNPDSTEFAIRVTAFDCPENAGFKQEEVIDGVQYGEYINQEGMTTTACLRAIPTSFDELEPTKFNAVTFSPEYSYKNLQDQTIKVYSPEENGNASILMNATNILPTNIGGAGLTKVNLTNLKGMSTEDAMAEENSEWRIRHNVPIPDITDNSIDDAEYYRLATVGQIWDLVKKAIQQESKAKWEKVYEVGSIYIGTQRTCPMTEMIPGSTWKLVAENRCLWGGDGSNATTTKEAGLPNHNHYARANGEPEGSGETYKLNNYLGSGTDNSKSAHCASSKYTLENKTIITNVIDNPIYGKSNTVQPPAYVVNIWRRTK